MDFVAGFNGEKGKNVNVYLKNSFNICHLTPKHRWFNIYCLSSRLYILYLAQLLFDFIFSNSKQMKCYNDIPAYAFLPTRMTNE